MPIGAERRSVLTLAVIFLATALLWNTGVVYPLKVLVVLFHEISHGIAAVLTGGSIVSIAVNVDQGGVCYTQGGPRFLTLTAGYLGSMGFGAALLVVASRTRWDRAVCAGLGVFLLAVTFLHVRNVFGFLFGLGIGGALIAGARLLPPAFCDMALKVIGLTSCLYAVLDIKSDVLDRPGCGSDADMLAQTTHIPAVIWGVLWILASLAVAATSLVVASRCERRAA